MKKIISLFLTLSSFSFGQETGCLSAYKAEAKKLTSKARKIEIGGVLEKVLSGITIITGISYMSEVSDYNAGEGNLIKSEKGKKNFQKVLAAEVGLVGSTFLVKSVKKKITNKKAKDLLRTLQFMNEAQFSTGEIFDKVYAEVKKENPYLYEEELAKLAYDLFLAPVPNIICPMGNPVTFKKFVKILNQQARFLTNIEEKK